MSTYIISRVVSLALRKCVAHYTLYNYLLDALRWICGGAVALSVIIYCRPHRCASYENYRHLLLSDELPEVCCNHVGGQLVFSGILPGQLFSLLSNLLLSAFSFVFSSL
ncbi:hypothetical protein E2C01_018949 [Portunus trituberculatus]|uniref:Uncharacterized protein n=1 Tax=Portunus trituberculatus TaxID=210409 RepID=A0A5B7DXV5_PORTR|nr:hypothetical protein [Portunus trituberculatus]